MLKDYAVTFLNLTTNRVKVDCFVAHSKEEAISDFKVCYRHGEFKVLYAVETGRQI